MIFLLDRLAKAIRNLMIKMLSAFAQSSTGEYVFGLLCLSQALVLGVTVRVRVWVTELVEPVLVL